MSSKSKLLAVVSTALLAGVCLPISAGAQEEVRNGEQLLVKVDIISSGALVPALTVRDPGSIATGNSVLLKTTGFGSDGIYVDDLGTADLADITLTTEGAESDGVTVKGSGKLNLVQSTVTTSGGQAFGVNAQGDGIVTLIDTKVKTDGANAHGISAATNAEVQLLGETSISASGENSAAVYARTGSKVTIDGASLETTNNKSTGVDAQGDGTEVYIKNGTSITTQASATSHGVHSGYGAFVDIDQAIIDVSGNGLNAIRGGSIMASNIVVTASGTGVKVSDTNSNVTEVIINYSRIESMGSTGSHGMHVTGAGGKIISNNVELITHDGGMNGFLANGSGAIMMSGGSIITNGDRSTGGQVQTAIAVVDSTVITTLGAESHGLSAHGGGNIDISGATIKTSGADARGLNVYDNGVIHGDLSIETDGDRAHGVSAIMGGEIVLQNSRITTSGQYAAAIASAQPANPIARPFEGAGTISIQNSVVSAENGASVLVDVGAGLDLALLNTDLEINNGQLFDVLFDGTMNASITNANLKVLHYEHLMQLQIW